MLGEHGLLHQLSAVELLHVADLNFVWLLCLINHWLDIVFQLLHYILILQLSDIHILTLDVGIEEGALFGRVAFSEALFPSQPLKLQVEVQDEQRVCEVDVCITPIVPGFQVHWQVKVVEGIRVALLYHI